MRPTDPTEASGAPSRAPGHSSLAAGRAAPPAGGGCARPTGPAGRRAWSCGSSTATRSWSPSAGSEEAVRLIGIDTPESVARTGPSSASGPEAKARTAELLPGGHRRCGSSATSRRATSTTACSPTSSATDDDVFVNLLPRRGGLRRGDRLPAQHRPPGRARPRPRRPARADRRGPVASLRGHRRTDRARVASAP